MLYLLVQDFLFAIGFTMLTSEPYMRVYTVEGRVRNIAIYVDVDDRTLFTPKITS